MCYTARVGQAIQGNLSMQKLVALDLPAAKHLCEALLAKATSMTTDDYF
jgi:hypothetical protein